MKGDFRRMRKMKRLIALVTVAMFLVSFAAPVSAATFSDVTGAASNDIYRLNSLGIITGYADGTFKPDANITRAEFAVIALAAAGLKSSADALKNAQSIFPDVAKGDWFNGWVNLAYSQGYMKGYPDGSFKPNANITYAECITVLVRILGYNENLPGVWPVEYLVKAAEVDITKDVTFSSEGLATRANISIMASQTLDADMVKWNKETDTFDDKYTPTQTLAENKFDLTRYDEDNVYVKTWGMDADGQYTITIGQTDNVSPTDTAGIYHDLLTSDTLTLSANCVINGAATVPGVRFQQIEFDYDAEEEEVTFINITSKKVTGPDEDVEIDGTLDAGTITVSDVDYKAADDIADYGAADTGHYVDAQAFYAVFVDKDGKWYISIEYTDSDGTATGMGIADAYNATTQKISFKEGTYGTVELKDQDVVIVKDGKLAAAADIAENNIIYVYDSVFTGVDFYLDVRTISATAKVNATYVDGSVKLADKKYNADGALMSTDGGDAFDTEVATNAELDDVYGLDVKYILGLDGDVYAIISDKAAASNTKYAVIVKAMDEDIDGLTTSIKLLKEDGSEVIFTVDTDEVELDYSGGGPVAATDIAVDDAVSYQLDANGKINDFELLDHTLYHLNDAVKDSNKIVIEAANYYLDANTVILNGRGGAADAAKETNSNLLTYLEDEVAPVNMHAWVKTSSNMVQYILFDTDMDVTNDVKGLVLDEYYKDGDIWIDIDVRGKTEAYELETQTWLAEDDVINTLYSYTLAGTQMDLDTLTVMTAGNVAGILDIDATHKSVEVNTDLYYEVDAETYIYDITDADAPVYLTFDQLAEGDIITYAISDDPDRVGVLDALFVVD
jgi:hypothetical protein